MFMRQQKLKRWRQHLQRICGTKAIWEVLAFSGRFDPGWLEQALRGETDDETAEPSAPDEASRQNNIRLHHETAEAIARYKEGLRLAQHREAHQDRGASQHVFTPLQLQVLEDLDSGLLKRNRNAAVEALGHGQLHRRCVPAHRR